MSDWFYYDQQGQKIGPITDSELRELIDQGLILPDTKLETDTGHTGKARQVPGLFPAAGQNAPAGAEAYCTHCGSPVARQAAVCLSCGCRPDTSNKFCRGCGTALNPEQVLCVRCGTPVQAGQDQYGSDGNGEDVPNYLVWAILEALFCCIPCGVIGIIYAVGANSAAETGNCALGRKRARAAKYWLIAGMVLAILAIILGVFFRILGELGASV
ncbi:MAG: CD225/dispanin family protein [Thermoguttaceae bacterium]|nr:CD225/dispanin family protein [Thermoguttaceae bacterium]